MLEPDQASSRAPVTSKFTYVSLGDLLKGGRPPKECQTGIGAMTRLAFIEVAQFEGHEVLHLSTDQNTNLSFEVPGTFQGLLKAE